MINLLIIFAALNAHSDETYKCVVNKQWAQPEPSGKSRNLLAQCFSDKNEINGFLPHDISSDGISVDLIINGQEYKNAPLKCADPANWNENYCPSNIVQNTSGGQKLRIEFTIQNKPDLFASSDLNNFTLSIAKTKVATNKGTCRWDESPYIYDVGDFTDQLAKDTDKNSDPLATCKRNADKICAGTVVCSNGTTDAIINISCDANHCRNFSPNECIANQIKSGANLLIPPALATPVAVPTPAPATAQSDATALTQRVDSSSPSTDATPANAIEDQAKNFIEKINDWTPKRKNPNDGNLGKAERLDLLLGFNAVADARKGHISRMVSEFCKQPNSCSGSSAADGTIAKTVAKFVADACFRESRNCENRCGEIAVSQVGKGKREPYKHNDFYEACQGAKPLKGSPFKGCTTFQTDCLKLQNQVAK